MHRAGGRVVAIPNAARPFLAVFTIDGEDVAEWPVPTREEGERQIADFIRSFERGNQR